MATKVVSFYSFKGGVGRSMSLSNVAVLLARKGHRVVCVDFDLEAGGLHTIFGIESRIAGKSTLLDLLTRALDPGVEKALVDVTDLLPSPVPGRLWLIPAVSEPEKLKEVMEAVRDIPMLLGKVINEAIEACRPHFVLVDSRSGFADLAAAPILKSNRLVCVLRPNKQNAEGLRMLLDILKASRNPLPIFLVLSQVPDLPRAKEKVEELQRLLGEGRRFDAQIPLVPELTLEEDVVAISFPESEIAEAYQPIVDWLERES